LLTLTRIGLIPPILFFIDNFSPMRSFIATMLYLLASLTDSLDGWLARRRKQVSMVGKFLDPLADKLMVTSVLVYLAVLQRVPPWLVVALLCRELVVTGLRTIAMGEGLVLSASNEGKQKTALQMIGTMFLLIHFRYPIWGLPGVEVNFHAVGIVTLYLALAMSLFSAIGYFVAFIRAVSRGRRERRAAAAQSPPPATP
jgi:CDP-diacylglycerol--glycerol-3-phosphate 3-phosphatidyltransferase